METNEIKDKIKEAYPNAHPKFAEITMNELDLHNRKNFDYASGGDSLGNFNRVAKIFELYPGLRLSDPMVVAFVYEMKQIDAVLWSLSRGWSGEVEGNFKRLADVSVYTKIQMILNGDNK